MSRLLVIGLMLPTLVLAACAGPVQTRGDTRGPGYASSGPPVRVPTVAELSNKTPIAVRALLGEPVMTRREAPAEVWQYTGQACVLDVVFYPDAAGAGLHSDWLEGRDMDGVSMQPQDCLALLIRGRR